MLFGNIVDYEKFLFFLNSHRLRTFNIEEMGEILYSKPINLLLITTILWILLHLLILEYLAVDSSQFFIVSF